LIVLSSPTPRFPPQKECQKKSIKRKSFFSFVDFVTQNLPSRDGRWEAIFNRSKWQPKVTLLLPAAAAAAEEKTRGKKLFTEPKAWTLGNKQRNKKEKQQKKF
jgi:hypothetical protein